MKTRIIHTLLAAMILCLPLFGVAQPSAKSALRILFVGYDPAKPLPTFEPGRLGPGGMSEESFKAEHPVRWPAFKGLLEQYFAEVSMMDVRDWKAGDSEAYDVTVFDFPSTPLKASVNEIGPDGNRVYKPAEYLPQDFSKPVVFIASTADQMGRSIGLKLDWLCLCLDADAHHVRTEHPIFQGPLEQVTPSFRMRPTPDGVFNYPSGKDLPKELPMWAVDQVGYLSSPTVRIGLVARGARFNESPDTEYISSGVCQKDVSAVALGRHGNFFLWGFGASPAGMTEEGKKVFVNAVAYMAQFDGRTPIARKYNDRMATTDDVRDIVEGATKEMYELYVASAQRFNEANAATKKRLEAKKAAGETLTKDEETQLQYAGYNQSIYSWEVFLKQRMGTWADRFGTDDVAFRKYMEENMGYVYCDPNAFFTWTLDEDAQEIGVSNHDIRLLDVCIEMLEKEDRPELAQRVLQRYTGENFSAASEWKNWLEHNRSKLFFTETDGYRFMVDTYSRKELQEF